tara:strand:+ start:136 stop:921 length:786 start_codon:yes stop_codon:yes gene_type:complete
MTGIVKTDQIQGAQGTTVTVPTGNTLAVTSNATVGGTLGVTGAMTTAAITSTGRHDVNFNGGATQAFKYTDTAGGNLASFGQFYNTSDALIGNVQNANNDGIHLNIKNGSIVFSNVGYTATNALNDYEEGTWTPTLVSTSASFAYSVRSGFYTKVGRVVNFTCAIQLDGGGNSFNNNSVALNGWPFQSTANAHSRFFIYGRYLNLDLGSGYTYAYAHLNGDSSSATLHESGDNVPTATIVSNDLSSVSGQLYLHGQYITDS